MYEQGFLNVAFRSIEAFSCRDVSFSDRLRGMCPLWLIRLVLAISFAVMPLQGLAQTVASLLCQPTTHHGQQLSASDHHHDEGSAVQAHSHAGDADLNALDDGTSANGHADHFCCSMVLTGLPASHTSLGVQEFSVLITTPGLVPSSTVLAFPQRPPLI